MLLAWAFFAGGARAAANCAACGEPLLRLTKLQKDKATHESLLKRNQDYLAKVGTADPSKGIKVKSNILIITVRIETFKNDIERTELEITQKGCKGCSTPITR